MPAYLFIPRMFAVFAAMRTLPPGEAWLEFKIDVNNRLTQTATFRLLGLLGRLCWYCVYPFHVIIFNGLIDRISTNRLIKNKIQ